MTAAVMQAIDRALETARQPKQLTRQIPAQLPPNMLDVIKCAAGDEPTLLKFASERNVSEQKIRDAARIYLQHIVTHANGSDRLVLALSAGFTSGDVREHKRWMLKWLHPDRNPSKWETNLFQRVKEASERLESGTGKEQTEKKASDLFDRKPLARRRRMGRPVPRASAAAGRVRRLNTSEMLKLIAGPVVLALLVTASVSIVWFRYGPQGGP